MALFASLAGTRDEFMQAAAAFATLSHSAGSVFGEAVIKHNLMRANFLTQ